MTSKAGYLLSLVNLGVTVQSAYLSLETNDQNAWLVVQDNYGDILVQAANRTLAYDKKCLDKWTENTNVNSDRVLMQGYNKGLDNEEMAEFAWDALHLINPYRFWGIEVYDNIGGGDDHYMICDDCFAYLHFQSKYDILIHSLGNDTVANTTVTTDASIADLANSKSHADDIANQIWSTKCVTGVHVIARAVDEWTDTDYETRMDMQVGSHHTIVVWAVDGFCGHEEDGITVVGF